jgi:hypothetical protein
MADATESTSETVPSSTFKVTLKRETFEIDIYKLTGHERLEAKRLLEVDEFQTLSLIRDEVGIYVLAYLAAKRLRPTLKFSDVLDLAGDELTIAIVGDEDGDADPFGGSSDPEPKAKRSSGKPSTED